MKIFKILKIIRFGHSMEATKLNDMMLLSSCTHIWVEKDRAIDNIFFGKKIYIYP